MLLHVTMHTSSLLGESLAIWKELGERNGAASTLGTLGNMAVRQGDLARGRSLCEQSLAIHREMESPLGLAQSFESLGILAAISDECHRAIRLMGAAEALRQEASTPLTVDEKAELERHVLLMRSALGEELFTREWAAGRLMSLEEAVECALSRSTR